MLFNSHIFMLLFLPLLLAGWYFLNWKKKFQLAQGYLIGMSLWFYAYANLQYLWLLLFSCLIGWLLSCLPEKIFSEKGKKVLTGVGCVFHLGLLGYFKYSNFFLENLNTVFHTDFPMLQILLPVGISFYTFQQLAYLIDRCRGDAPRDSFFDYLTFMGLFSAAAAGTDSASFRVYGAVKGAGKAQVSCRAVLGRNPVFRVRSRQKSAAGGYAGKGGQLWIQQCFDAGQHFGTASGGRVSDGAVL